MAREYVIAGQHSGFGSVLYNADDEFLIFPPNSRRPKSFTHLQQQLLNVQAEVAACGLQIATTPRKSTHTSRRVSAFWSTVLKAGSRSAAAPITPPNWRKWG